MFLSTYVGAMTNTDHNGISDVWNSELYQDSSSKYSDKAEYLLTYNFDTDSMPIFKSSKKSSWPVLLYINKLFSERFKHVLLYALWIGDKKSTSQMMNTFLKQFVEEAIQLWEWTEEDIVINNGQRRIIFKLAPMCCVVDSVARPIVQNRLQCNGYRDCSWYYAHGKYLREIVRYLFCEPGDLRNHETHKESSNCIKRHGNKYFRQVMRGGTVSRQQCLFYAKRHWQILQLSDLNNDWIMIRLNFK